MTATQGVGAPSGQTFRSPRLVDALPATVPARAIAAASHFPACSSDVLHHSGDDYGAARMAELDAKTVRAFREAKPRTLRLDHDLDRAAGRKLPPAERSGRMREIAHSLLNHALAHARR